MSFFGFGSSNASSTGDGRYFRHFNTGFGCTLKKTQFYVWFLGSKQSQGLRGREYVLPVVGELMDEGGRYPPPCKVTVQISEKGMKIFQSVPQLSRRTGKLKMELMKLLVPPHSITYSSIGPRPYTDVVSCILLLWNPDTRCPVHVHVYRCDSPETASIMHSALQILVDRPENQRALMDVERRLMARGLLVLRNHQDQIQTRPKLESENSNKWNSSTDSNRAFYELPADYEVESVGNWKIFSNGHGAVQQSCKNGYSNNRQHKIHMSPILERDESVDRVTRLHRAMFSELKEKLQSKGPLLLPPKDYSLKFVKSGLPTHFLAPNPWPDTGTLDSPSSRLTSPEVNANSNASRTSSSKRRQNEPAIENGIHSSTSTLAVSEKASDTGHVRRKLRLFGDTVRLKLRIDKTKSTTPIDDHRSRLSDQQRLATSTCTLLQSKSTQNGVSRDGNWMVTKPRFSSMQNLDRTRQDGSRERDIDSRAANYVGSATNSSCSLPREGVSFRRLQQRQPPPQPVIVCDPFGRKYERRMTVKNFWKNVQMPTRVEDNYGLWYLAPNDHCFP